MIVKGYKYNLAPHLAFPCQPNPVRSNQSYSSRGSASHPQLITDGFQVGCIPLVYDPPAANL